MLSCLSVSNQWETATKRIDIRTEQCSSICEFGIKLTAASPGVRVGTRSLGKRVRARPRTSNEGGQALVEFALLLPILLDPRDGHDHVRDRLQQLSGADRCRERRRAASCD